MAPEWLPLFCNWGLGHAQKILFLLFLVDLRVSFCYVLGHNMHHPLGLSGSQAWLGVEQSSFFLLLIQNTFPKGH